MKKKIKERKSKSGEFIPRFIPNSKKMEKRTVMRMKAIVIFWKKWWNLKLIPEDKLENTLIKLKEPSFHDVVIQEELFQRKREEGELLSIIIQIIRDYTRVKVTSCPECGKQMNGEQSSKKKEENTTVVEENSQEISKANPKKGRVVVQYPFEKGQYPMYRETNWKYSGMM